MAKFDKTEILADRNRCLEYDSDRLDLLPDETLPDEFAQATSRLLRTSFQVQDADELVRYARPFCGCSDGLTPKIRTEIVTATAEGIHRLEAVQGGLHVRSTDSVILFKHWRDKTS